MIKMLPRSGWVRLAVGLVVALVAWSAVIASVELTGPPSPITFTSGGSMAGLGAYPGQSNFYAAFLPSHPSSYKYQISHVRLIPLRGFRTPRLLGAMFLRTKGPPTAAPGYPPKPDNGSKFAMHPLAGYTATSGSLPFRPELVLMYGLHGDHLGAYAAAGIVVTYVVNGHSYTADIYNGAFLFYDPRHQTAAQHRATLARYSALNDRAAAALQKLAAGK